MISCSDRLRSKKVIQIERFPNNPLLIPEPESSWMSSRVFNCGVIQDDGLYKMLFRATFQETNITYANSNLGLALSTNGIEWLVRNNPVLRSGFNQSSMRGIEDPRIVKWVNNWYYIFTNVAGIDDLHIGIWKTKNFLEYKWVGIPFPSGVTSAAVFPELIEGNIYLLYRRFPHIWISRTQDINLQVGWEDHQIVIKAKDLYKSPENGLSPRKKIAMAAPPIKTPQGWLILVNVAHGKKFAEVYSIGFVVLDLSDPTKVKYIHPGPILLPEKPYEMEDGKRGICYCCAAVESPDKETFYVYWGAADRVIAGGRLMKEDLVGICY